MWTIPPCRCVFIPLFVTLLASMAGGQVQFQRLQKAHLPSGLQGTHALACGDVDGDGDIDIAQGVQFLRARLLLNDGTGKFSDATATRLPAGMDFCEALVMGDVDGDGDLDMILGNCGSYGSQNRLYLNDGKGYFTDVTSLKMPKRSDRTWALALGTWTVIKTWTWCAVMGPRIVFT